MTVGVVVEDAKTVAAVGMVVVATLAAVCVVVVVVVVEIGAVEDEGDFELVKIVSRRLVFLMRRCCDFR